MGYVTHQMFSIECDNCGDELPMRAIAATRERLFDELKNRNWHTDDANTPFEKHYCKKCYKVQPDGHVAIAKDHQL